MNSIFSMDNKFFSFMNRVADLIILNLLWLVCSIPLITAGASTTALFYVAMKMVKGEESYITRDFFKSFRQNFRQGTVIWLIMLAAGVFLAADIRIVSLSDISFKNYILPVFIFLVIVYSIILLYIFPLLARFENTTRNMFRNALLIGIRNLPYTILLGICTALILLAMYIVIAAIPFWIFIGIALTAFLYSFLYVRIFDKLIAKNDSDASSDKDDDTQE